MTSQPPDLAYLVHEHLHGYFNSADERRSVHCDHVELVGAIFGVAEGNGLGGKV